MQADKNILFLQNRVAYTKDEEAYKQLFFHFHPLLYRFAYNIIKNEEDAEDIVSEVMIKVWTMENKLAYINDLQLYLFKAVKNTAFTYLSSKKNSFQSLTDETEQTLHTTSNNLSEQKIIFSEINQKIEKAVIALPPQCQMVFRLIKEEGMSHKQVSSILEISQNTIETHMRIALKRIKLALEKYLVG